MLDSRSARDGAAIRRRRECLACGRRFTTYEVTEEQRVMVTKKDGRREPFDREKILRGLRLACMKRPVSEETLLRAVDEIERNLHDSGRIEVPSTEIGERMVELLRGLDSVAYVRFASVYKDFQDLAEFGDLIGHLGSETTSSRRRTRAGAPAGSPPLAATTKK